MSSNSKLPSQLRNQMAQVASSNAAKASSLEQPVNFWENLLGGSTCTSCPGYATFCSDRHQGTEQDDDDVCGSDGDGVSTCQQSESGILVAVECSKVFVACIDAFRFLVISCSDPFMKFIRRDTRQWHQDDWAFLKKNGPLVEEYMEKCNSLVYESIQTHCMVEGPLIMRAHCAERSVASALCSLKIVQVPLSERYTIDGEEVSVVVHVTLRHVKFRCSRGTMAHPRDGLQAEAACGQAPSELSSGTKVSL